MSKQQKHVKLDPPIVIEVEHIRSRAKRTLSVTVRWGNKIEGNWGNGAGIVVFDLRTGYGANEARDWRMTLESARNLMGDVSHLFSAPKHDKSGHVKVYAKSRQPDEQMSLLDYVAPSVGPANKISPLRPAFGPHDYEGQGRERYHDTPEHQRAELVGRMTAQLAAGTPEPDRAFARGWLDEHWRATRTAEKPSDANKELHQKAHAHLMREGACCDVKL